MVINIIQEPHALLHQKLSKINPITSEIAALAEEMKRKMVQWEGVGLAANQVGKNLQLFVILESLAEENKLPTVFINPEITEYSPETDEQEEGCLSLPGYFFLVPRAKKIKIKALDLNGRKIRFKARGFLARVLQHETDHLNGLLIKDRARTKN